jgi:hypothetical protein
MTYLRCGFLAFLCAGLGCVAAGGLEEYKDENGVTRVRTAPVNPVNTAANLVTVLGPWGILAAAGLRLGSKIIAHREILAHGQKDDDFDGVPDDQVKPPAEAPKV